MSTKRVLYKRETLYVGNWRENALLWLNEELPRRYYSKAARRRIEQLIETLQRLPRLMGHVRTIKRLPPQGCFKVSSIAMPEETHKSIRIVERLLRRYPSWPMLGWDGRGNLGFENVSFGRDFGQMKRADQEEAAAAEAVMSLAEVNELVWLRQCLCGKWFFAVRKAQKSCSANCRHKLYEQTERFKAKRRKYMKRYYGLQRSGKVK